MDDTYLIATFCYSCPCGREHRVILIGDQGDMHEQAYLNVQALLKEGCRVWGQHKSTVDRELIDGMLAPELGL